MKFKIGIFWDLIKILVSCSFTSFMASKTNTRSFYVLIRPSFFVLVYGFNFQQGTRHWRDVCFFCFVYSYKFYNRVVITKTALTKLLENTLDESWKLKNMSDKRLGCLTKSPLSQNFYWTMSDLLKTLISHPGSLVIRV